MRQRGERAVSVRSYVVKSAANQPTLSIRSGSASKRRVCPVGAVSKMTTSADMLTTMRRTSAKLIASSMPGSDDCNSLNSGSLPRPPSTLIFSPRTRSTDGDISCGVPAHARVSQARIRARRARALEMPSVFANHGLQVCESIHGHGRRIKFLPEGIRQIVGRIRRNDENFGLWTSKGELCRDRARGCCLADTTLAADKDPLDRRRFDKLLESWIQRIGHAN